MFGAILGGLGKAFLGGGFGGGLAKEALGGLFGGKGLGGMLGKLFSGGKGGSNEAEKLLGEIKNMLIMLMQKMDNGNGGQCSQGGSHQSSGAKGCGGSQQPCRPENPGHGHAHECGVNVPGFSLVVCGDIYGGSGDDVMYGRGR